MTPGAGTAPAIAFDHGAASVPDLEAAIAWYEDLLGFEVERRFTHPLFKKTVRRSKKYHAHDEKREAKTGDIVRIEETRPLSKLKRWTLVEKVAAGQA